MSEILLSNQSLSASHLKQQAGVEVNNLSSLASQNPKGIQAYTPYVVSPVVSPSNSTSPSKKNLSVTIPTTIERSKISLLSDPNVCRTVTDLSLCYGADNIMAIADVMAPYSVGTTGAAAKVYGNRMSDFGTSIKKYQDALLEYRKTSRAKSSTPADKALAKVKATVAYERLQSKFAYELKFSTRRLKAKQTLRSSLMNPQRGLNIAQSSRNVTKLNLTDSVHTKSLMNFAKKTQYLGNGLAIIDFGSRLGNIQNEYKAGGNWEKEMFIESVSFAASATAGIAAVNVGTAALGLLVVATPIGWVGLLVAGAAVAVSAAGTAILTDRYIKSNADSWYDSIMAWTNLQ